MIPNRFLHSFVLSQIIINSTHKQSILKEIEKSNLATVLMKENYEKSLIQGRLILSISFETMIILSRSYNTIGANFDEL
jgi:hypothetical protein